MAKRQKLSLRQKRRVASRNEKKLAATINVSDESLGDLQSGIVISRYGEQADVADEKRQVHRLYLRQNLGSCVSGDRVVFRLDHQGNGVVEAIEPRSSELTRPTAHAGVKTIVANVEQIFIVIAPLPDYSSLILDRYLVACELANIQAFIVLNKTDLLNQTQQQYFDQQLAIYRNVGYTCFTANCKQGFGIDHLLKQMTGKENILVGQSGVGKTSLINQLLPDVEALTGQVSENSRLGTHTTTASRLYFLPESGCIIDSPGVREFGLSHIEPEQLFDGFVEFRPYLGGCKFRNCKHLNEKGCALLKSAQDKNISVQRLENYQKIYQQITSSS